MMGRRANGLGLRRLGFVVGRHVVIRSGSFSCFRFGLRSAYSLAFLRPLGEASLHRRNVFVLELVARARSHGFIVGRCAQEHAQRLGVGTDLVGDRLGRQDVVVGRVWSWSSLSLGVLTNVRDLGRVQSKTFVAGEVVTFDVASDVTERCPTTLNDAERKTGEMGK
jgi:hypothetical protein